MEKPDIFQKPKILYKGNRVSHVKVYNVVRLFINLSRYRKEDDKFYERVFSEEYGPHAEYEIPAKDVPDLVRKILEAGTKKGVKKLREKIEDLSNFKDLFR